jgi:hypothetical protein
VIFTLVLSRACKVDGSDPEDLSLALETAGIAMAPASAKTDCIADLLDTLFCFLFDKFIAQVFRF